VHKRSLIFAATFLFVLQLAILNYITLEWKMPFVPGERSNENALIADMVFKGQFDYSFTYRNFMIQFLRLLWSFTYYADYWRAMEFFNIVFVDVGIIFAFLTAKQVFGKRTANFAFIIMFFVVGLNVNTLVYPYTDTFSVPFISGAVYLITRLCNEKNKNRRIMYALFCAAAVGFGYLVKAHAIAVAITAVLIFMVIPLFKVIANRTPPPHSTTKKSMAYDNGLCGDDLYFLWNCRWV
jgi:dolichyl-phosphate-mannose--protein O-mannosyl transferase